MCHDDVKKNEANKYEEFSAMESFRWTDYYWKQTRLLCGLVIWEVNLGRTQNGKKKCANRHMLSALRKRWLIAFSAMQMLCVVQLLKMRKRCLILLRRPRKLSPSDYFNNVLKF